MMIVVILMFLHYHRLIRRFYFSRFRHGSDLWW